MLKVEEKAYGGGETLQDGRKTYRMLEGGEEGTSGCGSGPGTGHPWLGRS